jgi:hypothetical protein
MNARKRRPASKKPQRWRAWGCVFARGLVATPLQTLALAHSEPQVRGAESFPISSSRVVDSVTDSGSVGAGGLVTRDLWGDVEEHEAYRRLDQRMARSASDTYRALQELNPSNTVDGETLEVPRELPYPTEGASPLPEAPPSPEIADAAADDINSSVDRFVVRQRLLATMGWTAVASCSNDVCPTPGASRDASRDADKATEVLLDGFRARRLAQAAPAGNRVENSMTQGRTTERQDPRTLRPSPPSTSSRATPGKLPTPTKSGGPIRMVSDSEREDQPVQPRTVQADFRLESVSGVGPVLPIEVRVTELQTAQLDQVDLEQTELAEDVLAEADWDQAEREPTDLEPFELNQTELDPTELDQAELDQAELDQAELDQADLKQADREQPDFGPLTLNPSEGDASETEVPGERVDGVLEQEEDDLTWNSATVSPERGSPERVSPERVSPERVTETDQVTEELESGSATVTLPLSLAPPTPLPTLAEPIARTEPSDPSDPAPTPAPTPHRGPAFAAVSDEDADDMHSQEARPAPTLAKRQGKERLHPTYTSQAESGGRAAGSPSPARSPQWHGVSDLPEAATAGVTDRPGLARAEVSDEDQSDRKVRAGVSDGALLVLERPVHRARPQRAAVSDEPRPARGSASDVREPVLAGATDRVTDRVADQVTDQVTDRVTNEGGSEIARSQGPSTAELIIMPAMEISPEAIPSVSRRGLKPQGSVPQDLSLESLAPRPLPDLEPREEESVVVESENLMRLDLAAPPRSAGEKSPRVARASVSSDDFSEQNLARPTRPAPRGELTTHGRVQLELQQSRVIRTRREVLRTEVLDPAICDVVQSQSGEISITGKRPGETHVRVWGQGKGTSGEVATNYLVVVGTANQQANRQADQHDRLVTRLAQEYPQADLEIIVSDDGVVVEGRVRSNQEAVDILSQVRQVWLVPVEDRITVRR